MGRNPTPSRVLSLSQKSMSILSQMIQKNLTLPAMMLRPGSNTLCMQCLCFAWNQCQSLMLVYCWSSTPSQRGLYPSCRGTTILTVSIPLALAHMRRTMGMPKDEMISLDIRVRHKTEHAHDRGQSSASARFPPQDFHPGRLC